MDERLFSEDRTLISLNKNKEDIVDLKRGTINYILSDGELLVTDEVKTSSTSGQYSRLIKEQPNGKIDHDLIFEGNVTIEQDLTVLGGATAIPVDSLSLEDTVLELNRGETYNGIMNKRSGVTINRGDLGYANIFYDEIEGGFNFCLDKEVLDVTGNSTIQSKIILEFSNLIAEFDNQDEFTLPGFVNSAKDAFIVFINNVYYPDIHYTVSDNTIKMNLPLVEGDEVSFIRLSVRQKSTMSSERDPIEDRIASINKNSVILNTSYYGEARFNMPHRLDKEKESALVFVNGVILPPSQYEIDDNILYLNVSTSMGTEIVVAFIKSDSVLNDFKISQANFSIELPFNETEIEVPFTLDNEGDAVIVFKNSVLLDSGNYKLDGTKLILNSAYPDDCSIDIFRMAPINLGSYSDRINTIREADAFDKLMSISDKGHLEVKESLATNSALIRDKTHMHDVTINENEFGKALTVNGKATVNGINELNGPTYINNICEHNEVSSFNERVNLRNEVVFDRESLMLNRALKKTNGGIKFDRRHAGNAVLEWKEEIKKWCAGIEGTEKPIITQSELYHIIDKLIDICELDTDIHTSVKTETYTLFSDGTTDSIKMKIPYIKNPGEVEFVFRNGILLSEQDYNINLNEITLSKVLGSSTEVNVVRIYLEQHSLIGTDIKEYDRTYLVKKNHQVDLVRDSQKQFILPFEAYEYSDSIFVFVNGAYLTKDMYIISGSLLTLMYEAPESTEVEVVTISTSESMSFNKVFLSSKQVKVTSSEENQREFYIPYGSNLEKQDVVLFGNTVFIPDEDYEVEDRKITFKDGKSIPTELSVIFLNPFNRRGFGITDCDREKEEPFSRYYSFSGEPYQSDFYVPFTMNPANSTIMVFHNGRCLSRNEFDIRDRAIIIYNPQEESELIVMDFVSKYDESFGDSRLGMRSYNFTVDDNFKISYKLPFTVKKDETSMVFIDGKMIGKTEYGIDGDGLLIYKKLFGGENVLVQNFSNVVNVQYQDRYILKEKYIHEQENQQRTWVIKHNLNTYPHVTAIDEDNKTIRDVDIVYLDMNTLAVELKHSLKGKAILN